MATFHRPLENETNKQRQEEEEEEEEEEETQVPYSRTGQAHSFESPRGNPFRPSVQLKENIEKTHRGLLCVVGHLLLKHQQLHCAWEPQ